MNAGISVIVPTRGRLKQAIELVKSFEDTAALRAGWSEIVLVLDQKDELLEDYLVFSDYYAISYILAEGNMVERSNIAAKLVDRDIIGWAADDQRFRTPGWEAAIVDAFDDSRVGFVVTNDYHYKGEKAANVFTRKSIIDALGYFLLPSQQHLYIDDAWLTLGRASDTLVYLDDVVIEHMHPYYGKGELDEYYNAVNQPSLYVADEQSYLEWKDGKGLLEDVRKVRECLGLQN